VSARYDCAVPEERERGISRAVSATSTGELVVLPTDTVYGVGCDAFSPSAVNALLAAKGRGRDMPPPVLVGHARTLDGLAIDVPDAVRELAETFWPGALTIVCRAQPSLDWDLGDTFGTVAIRMPLHPIALQLLEATGPMAVSSANRSGRPAATSCAQAEEELGEAVAIYLDGGMSPEGLPSTIVDGTRDIPRVLRLGALSLERLREVVPELADREPEAADREPEAADRE
jgi:tRNA threonylcarbamoyl adenosine modification protein (Sua5/YciO/YrdC/YwlC family)